MLFSECGRSIFLLENRWIRIYKNVYWHKGLSGLKQLSSVGWAERTWSWTENHRVGNSDTRETALYLFNGLVQAHKVVLSYLHLYRPKLKCEM
jgi:hypothetical protein